MSTNATKIFVPKYGGKLGEGFSRAEVIDSYAWAGRRTKLSGYQSPASCVLDFADARKAIQLCDVCRVHFNPRKEHYRVRWVPTVGSSGYLTTGPCDACNQRTNTNSVFCPEEIWEMVSCDPAEAKAHAQMVWNQSQRFPSVNNIIDRIRRRLAAVKKRRAIQWVG